LTVSGTVPDVAAADVPDATSSPTMAAIAAQHPTRRTADPRSSS
jgi:hypothetical protein